jgi:hypothetical protein
MPFVLIAFNIKTFNGSKNMMKQENFNREVIVFLTKIKHKLQTNI